MTPGPESPVKVKPDQPRRIPCRIAWLAEAPGETEIGWTDPGPRPLVGSSGVTFNQLLRAANIEREAHWVGNVFNQKAVNNDVVPWMRDPAYATPALARLQRELERVQPEVVVAMGGTALWAMTGETQVGDQRGHFQYATRTLPGVKVMPTFHPAFVQRMWKFFGTVVGDFVKADNQSRQPRGTRLRYDAREVWIDPTYADMEWFEMQHLKPSPLITIDIETVPRARQITCIGFGGVASSAIVVPFVDDRKPNRSYWPTVEAEVRAWAWVRRICALPQAKLMQNGTYDAQWLWARMGIPVMNYSEDTRLLHHALYPELPKDLAVMGAAYTEQPAWKSWRGAPKAGEKRDA